MGDYAVYVLTLVLSITMIFAYNSLLFSDAINSFSKLMRPMMSILICVTVMVVFILGWLISYITHFIFEHRSHFSDGSVLFLYVCIQPVQAEPGP